jgi:hypothetical protein
MEPSSLPIPLSLIISDVISSGGGGMGGGDANYSYARSPLSTLLSSALAPPASSPGGQLKSPKSPLLLVVSPGAGENITHYHYLNPKPYTLSAPKSPPLLVWYPGTGLCARPPACVDLAHTRMCVECMCVDLVHTRVLILCTCMCAFMHMLACMRVPGCWFEHRACVSACASVRWHRSLFELRAVGVHRASTGHESARGLQPSDLTQLVRHQPKRRMIRSEG